MNRPLTAAEKRERRFWPPIAGLLIVGAWYAAALIEGAPNV